MKLVWQFKICFNETYSKVRIGKHFSDNFPVLFNVVLEYAIKKVENQVGLKLHGARQLLIYAYDVDLLRDNIDTIKKNA
jgi:hypothetical protein